MPIESSKSSSHISCGSRGGGARGPCPPPPLWPCWIRCCIYCQEQLCRRVILQMWNFNSQLTSIRVKRRRRVRNYLLMFLDKRCECFWKIHCFDYNNFFAVSLDSRVELTCHVNYHFRYERLFWETGEQCRKVSTSSIGMLTMFKKYTNAVANHSFVNGRMLPLFNLHLFSSCQIYPRFTVLSRKYSWSAIFAGRRKWVKITSCDICMFKVQCCVTIL